MGEMGLSMMEIWDVIFSMMEIWDVILYDFIWTYPLVN